MRDASRIMLLAVMVAFLGAAAEGAQRGSVAFVNSGEVVIFADGASRIIVAADTAEKGADGMIDLWFVLQGAEPAMALPMRARSATLLYREGALRVVSRELGAVYDFAVDGYDATWAAREEQASVVVRTIGSGLSRNVAETTMPVASPRRSGRATATNDDSCPICDPFTNDPGDGSGAVGSSCQAGGAGAISCTLTNGTRSCTVHCKSTEYACCFEAKGTLYCKCYPNP